MDKILNVAEYIFDKYQKLSGETIDEMKLHKLLYFSQRECIAITGNPLFDENFEGWKYGPVSRDVRLAYTKDGIISADSSISDQAQYIVNNVILEYGVFSSWKLSEISHQEISWKKSRIGLADNENGSNPLELSDIYEDAKKIRPYDHVWDMYYDEFEDAEVNEQ